VRASSAISRQADVSKALDPKEIVQKVEKAKGLGGSFDLA